jgi:hypothetical protein
MEYLITPPEKTDWKINQSHLVDNLVQQWSDIEIQKVNNSDDYYVLEWCIEMPGSGQRLDGALHRDEQGISLDGYLEDCVRFAVWFRYLVPERQKLVFYDQGYNSSIELHVATTESEIWTAFMNQNHIRHDIKAS